MSELLNLYLTMSLALCTDLVMLALVAVFGGIMIFGAKKYGDTFLILVGCAPGFVYSIIRMALGNAVRWDTIILTTVVGAIMLTIFYLVAAQIQKLGAKN